VQVTAQMAHIYQDMGDGMKIKGDICIIGAGSGGVAAAYSAAKNAPDKVIVLVEAYSMLGGTSTVGGVNAWEPGVVGNSTLHKILFDELYKSNDAVIDSYHRTTARPRLCAWVEEDRTLNYSATLHHEDLGRVVFNPWAMHRVMEKNLLCLGNVKILYCSVLTGVSVSDGHILNISVYNRALNESITVEADLYIDSSAEIVLARMAGCKAERSCKPNGVSQMFIIERKGYRKVECIPEWVYQTDAIEWIYSKDPDVIFNRYPDGKYNVNTCPTMEGYEYINYGLEAKKIALARTYAFWNVLQKERGLDEFRLSYIFPMIGIREGYRLVGKHVLCENDIRSNSYRNNTNIIAFADHSLDVHSAENKKSAQALPSEYGVPLECCLSNQIDNIAVACRGISVSNIVASSCRLQRTIMQIGESVGQIAAMINGSSFCDYEKTNDNRK